MEASEKIKNLELTVKNLKDDLRFPGKFTPFHIEDLKFWVSEIEEAK